MSASSYAMPPPASRTPLAPALAASLVVHVAIAAALAPLAATGRTTLGIGALPLVARLVTMDPGAGDAPSLSATPGAPSDAAAPAMAAPAAAAVAIAPAPPSPAAAPAAASPPTSPALATGAPGIAQTPGSMGLLSAPLLARIESEYPAEIDAPVQVVIAPTVAWPDGARRAGTVVAWIAVDAAGTVEDVVVDGEADLGEAVRAAVLAAKFLPARNRGAPIRFFTILRFDFGVGTTAATTLPDGAGTR